MCSHIPLKERNHIRKVMLQQWRNKNGSTVFILTSPKTEKDLFREQKKFGDMIPAEHEVLNEGSESRNNHRFAVVVQDLATQWIQYCPCKTKTSQETDKKLRKFLEPYHKPKVIYTKDSSEFGKSCKEISWNHQCPRLIDQRQAELQNELYVE